MSRLATIAWAIHWFLWVVALLLIGALIIAPPHIGIWFAIGGILVWAGVWANSISRTN